MAGRPKSKVRRSRRVLVSLSDRYGEALETWADQERRATATLANMLLEKLIDAKALIAQGRVEEAEAVFAELKANCENRTRDLRFTKPLASSARPPRPTRKQVA